MRLFFSGIFLTLVLSGADCHSAPTKERKPPAPRPSMGAEIPVQVVTPEIQETTSPTYPAEREAPPTVVKEFGPPRARISEWTFEARVRFVGGYLLKPDTSEAGLALGAQAVWAPALDRAWDFAVDATDNRLVIVGAGRRFPFESERVPSAYWKLAASQTLEANSFFGTVVELQRLKGWVGLGTSDLFEWDRNLNAEVQLGYGLAGIGYSLHVGWNF